MALLTHRDHDDRPWGSYDRFTHNEPTTVKVLEIKPGQRLSLQYHKQRAEFWRVLSGSGTATLDGSDIPAHPGDEFEIPIGMPHRLAGGDNGITVLEISVGHFNEHDDLVRLADDYGRSSPSTGSGA